MRDDGVILLGHGGGGVLTSELLRDVVFPPLQNPILQQQGDGACVTVTESELVLTTDSFVVDPLFFPGGDIGTLAACGTLNDLAMQGAEPRYLTLGMILEEGFPIRDLRTIIASLAATVREVGAQVVAGDTKVVERGKGSGVYLNTTGLGVRLPGTDVQWGAAQPGDVVLINGFVGDHGMAVLSRRRGLEFASPIVSDVAPLWGLVRQLLTICPEVRGLRDPTRGGLAAALHDLVQGSGHGVRLRAAAVPVRPAVRSACDMLGMDPFTVANEGKVLVVCPEAAVTRALAAMRSHPLGVDAAVIGRVTAAHQGRIIVETEIGGERMLSPPTGEELPRIC